MRPTRVAAVSCQALSPGLSQGAYGTGKAILLALCPGYWSWAATAWIGALLHDGPRAGPGTPYPGVQETALRSRHWDKESLRALSHRGWPTTGCARIVRWKRESAPSDPRPIDGGIGDDPSALPSFLSPSVPPPVSWAALRLRGTGRRCSRQLGRLSGSRRG